MKNDKGITLVMLVVTVVLLGVLITFLIKDSPFNQLLQEKNKIERDFNELINQTDEKINSIREQWGNLI